MYFNYYTDISKFQLYIFALIFLFLNSIVPKIISLCADTRQLSASACILFTLESWQDDALFTHLANLQLENNSIAPESAYILTRFSSNQTDPPKCTAAPSPKRPKFQFRFAFFFCFRQTCVTDGAGESGGLGRRSVDGAPARCCKTSFGSVPFEITTLCVRILAWYAGRNAPFDSIYLRIAKRLFCPIIPRSIEFYSTVVPYRTRRQTPIWDYGEISYRSFDDFDETLLPNWNLYSPDASIFNFPVLFEAFVMCLLRLSLASCCLFSVGWMMQPVQFRVDFFFRRFGSVRRFDGKVRVSPGPMEAGASR